MTLITTEDGIGRHWLLELCAPTYNNARLDQPRANTLNEHGGEFRRGLLDLINQLAVHDSFPKEEVLSNRKYPNGYSVRPLKEQIMTLARIFGLDPVDALKYMEQVASRSVIKGADQFAVISDIGLTRLFSGTSDSEDRFCQGIQLVLDKIGATRPFHNFREKMINRNHLRRHPKTQLACDRLTRDQVGDIWIIDAQLGIRHLGRSIRRAQACFCEGEFDLDPIAGGSIILTHPERLQHCEELDFYCAGGEFFPTAGGFSRKTLRFEYGDERVNFGPLNIFDPIDFLGSATGFLTN